MLAAIIVVEYVHGRLKKPWLHWLLIVLEFVTIGWVIYISNRGAYLWTAGAALPIAYYLAIYLFQNHVIGSERLNNESQNNNLQDTATTKKKQAYWMKNSLHCLAPGLLSVIAIDIVLFSSNSPVATIYLSYGPEVSASTLALLSLSGLSISVLLISCTNGLFDVSHTWISGAMIGMWASIWWIAQMTVAGGAYARFSLTSIVVVPIGLAGGMIGLCFSRKLRKIKNNGVRGAVGQTRDSGAVEKARSSLRSF